VQIALRADAMMPAILFDVDGVLVHGYHARPELRRRWDEHLQRDLHIDPERFQKEFIFGPFVQQVITGQMDLKQALTEHLPSLGHLKPTAEFFSHVTATLKLSDGEQPLLFDDTPSVIEGRAKVWLASRRIPGHNEPVSKPFHHTDTGRNQPDRRDLTCRIRDIICRTPADMPVLACR
jgi:FMN phosphatase YigB (HAD superfamily)